jgi:hypothetical protein
MDNCLRRVLSLVDENKYKIPEGDYIEICKNLSDIRKIHNGENTKPSLFINVGKLAKTVIIGILSSNVLKRFGKINVL